VIKYFTIENYRSIKNENILEFDANLREDSIYPAHPVIGFAGANASGKTNALQSLTFVFWFMQHSFLKLDTNDDIPCEPFHSLSELPSEFHVIFAQKSVIEQTEKMIDYEYKLQVTPEKVVMEVLNYYPHGEEELVYRRQENMVEFGKSVSPIDTKDLRQNCSIVSLAAQFASQTIANICKNYSIGTTANLENYEDKQTQVFLLQKMLKTDGIREKILPHLKIADVGIDHIELSAGKRVILKHRIDEQLADFELSKESAGTLAFLIKIFYLVRVLEKGEVLIIDEIELKLHQNLVVYLLGLFASEMNRQGAQLICSFHNSYCMEFLEPEQLWFAEKNEQGQTELFSAAAFTDIKELYKKDLELLYRVGRFGAKPRAI